MNESRGEREGSVAVAERPPEQLPDAVRRHKELVDAHGTAEPPTDDDAAEAKQWSPQELTAIVAKQVEAEQRARDEAYAVDHPDELQRTRPKKSFWGHAAGFTGQVIKGVSSLILALTGVRQLGRHGGYRQQQHSTPEPQRHRATE